MKKALVLGIMALFAINVATVQDVNAQNRTGSNKVSVTKQPGKDLTGKNLKGESGQVTTVKDDEKTQPKAKDLQGKDLKGESGQVTTVKDDEKNQPKGKDLTGKGLKTESGQATVKKDSPTEKTPAIKGVGRDKSKKEHGHLNKSVPPTPKDKTPKTTGTTNNNDR